MMLEKAQESYLKDLVKLMSQIVEQNNILIKNSESKQDYIIELLEALVEESEEVDTNEEVNELYSSLD